MILLAAFLGLVFGAYIYRAAIDGILSAQEAAHKKEMAALTEELTRARIQVANLIGKE